MPKLRLRLLGLTASSQAAFLLLAALSFRGATAATPALGATALLFGIAVFGVAVLSGYAVLGMLQTAGIGDGVDEFRGLGQRAPLAAALLALTLCTLAGVPPLAGFLARFLALQSSMAAGNGCSGARR